MVPLVRETLEGLLDRHLPTSGGQAPAAKADQERTRKALESLQSLR